MQRMDVLELAVGLSYLTKRNLVYYGLIGPEKKLSPIRGGNSSHVPAHRKAFINNTHIPTILELFEELPVPNIKYKHFVENCDLQKLTTYESKIRLVNSVFCSEHDNLNNRILDDFTEGRTIFQDVRQSILHICECNLGYYSRCFYAPPPSFPGLMDAVRPKFIYRNFADRVCKLLGQYNGIHVRLTDFRKFLSVPNNYPEKILRTIRDILPTKELLVICTDEAENKEFWTDIVSEYKNCIFLDEFIFNELNSDFQNLPFTDEVTLSLICNIVMWKSSIFAGTPGSTFSGLIHRNWLREKINFHKHTANYKFNYICSSFSNEEVSFYNAQYTETKAGLFSWNRLDLPICSETKSWFREWVESVYMPDYRELVRLLT